MPRTYTDEDYRKDSLLYVLSAKLPHFYGITHSLLLESLPRYMQELKKIGIDEIWYPEQDVKAFIISGLAAGYLRSTNTSRYLYQIDPMSIVMARKDLSVDQIQDALEAAESTLRTLLSKSSTPL